jgi:hypothetical protein
VVEFKSGWWLGGRRPVINERKGGISGRAAGRERGTTAVRDESVRVSLLYVLLTILYHTGPRFITLRYSTTGKQPTRYSVHNSLDTRDQGLPTVTIQEVYFV